MAKNYYDITIALAGICQSVRLVQKLAHGEEYDQDDMLIIQNSIMQTNPSSTLEVYGDNEQVLHTGLETLLALLNSQRQSSSIELTRYAVCLMALARKLSANRTAMGQLSERIEQVKRQLLHFDLASETIQNALATIYVDVISPLGTQIRVIGSATALQQPLIQARVRATLLAGIRASILWQQVGGSRLQLLFSRNRLFQQVQSLLT